MSLTVYLCNLLSDSLLKLRVTLVGLVGFAACGRYFACNRHVREHLGYSAVVQYNHK